MQGHVLALSGAQKLSVFTAHKAPRSTKNQVPKTGKKRFGLGMTLKSLEPPNHP